MLGAAVESGAALVRSTPSGGASSSTYRGPLRARRARSGAKPQLCLPHRSHPGRRSDREGTRASSDSQRLRRTMLRAAGARLAPRLLPPAGGPGLEGVTAAAGLHSSAAAQGVGIPERRLPEGTGAPTTMGLYEGEIQARPLGAAMGPGRALPPPRRRRPRRSLAHRPTAALAPLSPVSPQACSAAAATCRPRSTPPASARRPRTWRACWTRAQTRCS